MSAPGALAAARDRITEERVRATRARYGLRPGLTGLYAGALDGAARVPFLLAAADRTAALLPGFRLLVAGDGERRTAVEDHGPHVVPVPGASGDDHRALLGAVADVLLAPGAVGPLAADSFALRTPLVITDRAERDPGFGCLEDGRNAVVAPDDPDAYGAAVAELLTRPRRLACLRRACRADAQRYTVEGRTARAAHGVEHLVHGIP
ncbi:MULTISPECIES: glycosyltransferase [unclassified Streptomyces]|uniref:glycosyltransferase n=1 Tax=unclassified Streptomyces TaxID=2593676 RepID=UPI000DC3BA2A|nr:glycosyltransferase [Streptomyces sp. PsTaAH-137]MYT70008.1 glycosyltransferase [Streptomyces sp. SID8367]RAJ88584.1 glycosyl transferase family 1 [Streptomyces sp. PsTaAH-137]